MIWHTIIHLIENQCSSIFHKVLKFELVFHFAVVNQEYTVQVHDEYVMSGNTAVLKCQVIWNVFVTSSFNVRCNFFFILLKAILSHNGLSLKFDNNVSRYYFVLWGHLVVKKFDSIRNFAIVHSIFLAKSLPPFTIRYYKTKLNSG